MSRPQVVITQWHEVESDIERFRLSVHVEQSVSRLLLEASEDFFDYHAALSEVMVRELQEFAKGIELSDIVFQDRSNEWPPV
jgi:hypothetical protein